MIFLEEKEMVSKDTLIGELLQIDIGTAPILMAAGMHCLGCPASQAESLEEAAAVHGLDAQELVDEINSYLEKKAAGEAQPE
jgi:hybrid cluster-associated redox disulfide protein